MFLEAQVLIQSILIVEITLLLSVTISLYVFQPNKFDWEYLQRIKLPTFSKGLCCSDNKVLANELINILVIVNFIRPQQVIMSS